MKTAIIAIIVFILLGIADADAKARQSHPHRAPARAATEVAAPTFFSFPGRGLVDSARGFLGTNPTGWDRVWCARFMRMVLRRIGRPDPGVDYNKASNWLKLGRAAPAGAAGAIVVWSRHLGVIVRPTRPGFAVVISGNTGPKGARVVMEQERSLVGALGFRYL
jgi:hypothetical protein